MAMARATQTGRRDCLSLPLVLVLGRTLRTIKRGLPGLQPSITLCRAEGEAVSSPGGEIHGPVGNAIAAQLFKTGGTDSLVMCRAVGHDFTLEIFDVVQNRIAVIIGQ